MRRDPARACPGIILLVIAFVLGLLYLAKPENPLTRFAGRYPAAR